MSRLSFQQLLIIAFFLITITMGATSIQALLALEKLSAESHDAARLSVQLTEESEHLEELTVTMERTARQFFVLDDSAFRDRYESAWREATVTLDYLTAHIPNFPVQTVTEWKTLCDTSWKILSSDDRHDQSNEQTMSTIFLRLPQLNNIVALDSKREIVRRSDALMNELAHQQRLLALLIFAAISLTAFTALGIGMWLSRPLRRIENAIEQLGANRFDQPIEIGGPNDTRRLGKHLNWLRLRLAELEADKARFVRHISHELKTPLAALCEGVSLFEDEVIGPLTGKQREVAVILRQNTMSLQTQIDDLLRYNAATFGAQHLERSTIEIKSLLNQVIEEQRLQWQAQSLRVEVLGAPIIIQADYKKLLIAFANILSNAVRFSPYGGEVKFTLSSHTTHVTIDCTDQGVGVAGSEATKIFEPFYQGTRQVYGARKGNGIGLSIVREYIEAHSGRVRIFPHDGGAHFQIELPYGK
jgi:two-component system sensor histidine kinase GlrK